MEALRQRELDCLQKYVAGKTDMIVNGLVMEKGEDNRKDPLHFDLIQLDE